MAQDSSQIAQSPETAAAEPPKPQEPAPAQPEEADVLEGSTLAIVQADLQREVQYANPAARRMFGVSDYKGLRLDDFFADEESRETLRSQLARRRQGLIGNYQVNVLRKPEDAVIPVEVTGIPIFDEAGNVAGSLGLFRSLATERLVSDVHTLNRSGETSSKLLLSVGQRIKKVIPFDVMIVTRYSKNERHAHSFFVWGLAGALQTGRRWIPLTQEQVAWIRSPGAKVIDDMPKLLDDPLWASMREEPFVKSLVSAGCKSVLLRAAYGSNRLNGVISLVSRTPSAFTAEHKAILEQLPLDATMAHALEHNETRRYQKRLELVQVLNGCTAIKAAAKKLVEHLHRAFEWSHVAVFRIEEPARKIALVEQKSSDARFQLDGSYDQPIDAGVLGRVTRDAKPAHVENTMDDPDYVHPPGWPEGGSELCCPIILKDDKAPRWIINVEDPVPGAFSTDEYDELVEIADDVATVMQRISQFYFLTQSFDHASDPIFVTDANLDLRKANRAAAQLVGWKKGKDVKGNLASLLGGGDLRQRLAESVSPALGEFTVTVQDAANASDAEPRTVPVDVSYQAFPEPEGLGGYVFVAKDMRQLRRSLELELLEKAAYEVAVEVSSPLALAIASVERLAAKRSQRDAATLEKVRRQLGRVKRAYTKLALFNREARPKDAQFMAIDLQAEVESIRSALAPEEAKLVHVAQANHLPSIKGDPFQVSFMLETLLSVLVRAASQREGAKVELAARGDEVELRLSGFLPGGSLEGEASALGSTLRAELQIAEPLISEFAGNHHGSFERGPLSGGRHEFVLRFPALAPS